MTGDIMHGKEVIDVKDGNPKIVLRLAPEIIEALKDLARQQGRTLSEVVREEILNLLDRNGIDYSPR